MEDFSDFDAMMGITPEPPATPELGLYKKLTEDGKYKAIYNIRHWFKHELYIQLFLNRKDMHVCTPSGSSYSKVKFREIGRAILEYYCWQNLHTHFSSERAASMGKQVDMEKFLDLMMEHPDIKKLIDNPHELI